MAKDQSATWRGVSIEQGVDDCADALIDRGLATGQRGYSEIALRTANQRLGRQLPAELEIFYSRITPVSECPPAEFGLVGFQPLDDPDLTWLGDSHLRKEKLWVLPDDECPLEGWSEARLMIIGYTPFGDWLIWCEGIKNYPSGTIVLTDHEGDENPVVLGDSLGEWLARYSLFGVFEPAIAPASLGEIDKDLALAFLHDHIRLNPQSVWADEMRQELEKE